MGISKIGLQALKKIAESSSGREQAIMLERLYSQKFGHVPLNDPMSKEVPTLEDWIKVLPENFDPAIELKKGYAGGGEVKATPAKNEALAWLAEKLGRADSFARKPFGYDNPPVAMISDLFSIPAVQKTLERKAYGEDLTSGRGWTTRMKPETEEALLAATQLGSPLSKVAQLTKGMPVGASIKNVGGNWLSGSVEDALKGLKRTPTAEEAWLMQHARPGALDAAVSRSDAVDTWIDKQLTRYVKNDMATPEDPIRLMADAWPAQRDAKLAVKQGQIEKLMAKRAAADPRAHPMIDRDIEAVRSQMQGIADYVPLHVNPEALNFRPEMHGKFMEPGQVPMGTSPAAKAWDGAADIKVYNNKAGAIVGNDSWVPAEIDANIANNPWLTKVPPDTPVHSIAEGRSLPQDLGFNHLIDELRNATNPASGLPPELLLKYSSLPQVSVPQAVERVAAINAWREAQKVEANLAKANNAATVLHKDYPDKGFKWVELKKSEQLPEGWKEFPAPKGKGGGRTIWESPSGEIVYDDPRTTLLADTLKYEGDTMGHCVGGYCDEVASGASRIFSLRNAKGTPHTTIEVAPKRNIRSYMETLEDPARPPEPGPLGTKWTLHDRVQRERSGNGDYDQYANKLLQELGMDAPQDIVQIKGKANRKPNDEYLPYVQDFVKSGKWSEVGDLNNSGLVEYTKGRQTVPQGLQGRTTMGVPFDEVGIPEGYYTNDELLGHMRDWQERTGNKPNFADGGLAQTTVQGYNPARVQEIADALRAELFN
jgi:hypothetical protein